MQKNFNFTDQFDWVSMLLFLGMVFLAFFVVISLILYAQNFKHRPRRGRRR